MKESEDNLENFFRNRAESSQYEFQEEDWAKMEEKLDKGLPIVSPNAFSKYYWMGAGAIIMAVLFFSYFAVVDFMSKEQIRLTDTNLVEEVSTKNPSDADSKSSRIAINESTNQPDKLAKQLQPKTTDTQLKTTISNQKNTATEIKKEQAVSQINTKNSTAETSVVAPVTNDSEIIASINNKDISSIRDDSQIDNTITDSEVVMGSGKNLINSTSSKKPLVAKNLNNQTNLIDLIQNQENTINKLNISEVYFINKEAAYKLDTVSLQKTPYVFANNKLAWVSITSFEHNKRELPSKKIWTLSVNGAIDASKSVEGNFGKPKIRVGIYGEYFISDRFSLGIGANVTTKSYVALSGEYTPPKGFWTNGIAPETTTAECQVLDIPVTVNYYQPITSKSSIQFQLGASSWFMLKENYWYNYEQNDPSLIQKWGTTNENNYFFSVVNLGVNYFYQLNKKWALGIGPYINIPLSGIGHGNVNLKNAGLKASFQFNKYKIH